MKAAAQNLQVQEIAVDLIVPSPTNPRTSYDQAALEELAGSIKSAGVQVPLALRVSEHGTTAEPLYEIVGGERRWRAAQIAGLETVPAIVRTLTDQEMREAQLVDNLQRADLTPMDEAECYEQLVNERSLPIEVLAAKVGKTVPYVTQRLRLLSLIPEARQALHLGVINLTLALLIARLAPGMQERATVKAVDPRRQMHGPLAERIDKVKKHFDEDLAYYRCATETELREWISENTLLSLKDVAWRLDDVDLIPNAGPCTECPKRAGNAPALFGDIAADGETCTDPECYDRKRKAAVKEVLKHGTNLVKLLDAQSHLALKEGATALKRGQWLEAKVGSCAKVIEGVTEQGKRLTVCPDQKCKVHKHQVQQPMAKGQSSNDWEARQKERETKEKAYLASETPIRRAIYEALKPKLKGSVLLRATLVWLLEHIAVQGLADLRGVKSKDHGVRVKALGAAIDKAKDGELEAWLADALVCDTITPNDWNHDRVAHDREDLWRIGKVAGVDCDAIVRELTKGVPFRTAKPEPAPAAKPAEAKAKPAKAVAKKAPAKKAAKKAAARKAAKR